MTLPTAGGLPGASLLPVAIAPLNSGNVYLIDRCVPPCGDELLHDAGDDRGRRTALRQQPALAVQRHRESGRRRPPRTRRAETARRPAGRRGVPLPDDVGFRMRRQISDVDSRSRLQRPPACETHLGPAVERAAVDFESIRDPRLFRIVRLAPQPRDFRARRHAVLLERFSISRLADRHAIEQNHRRERAAKEHERHDMDEARRRPRVERHAAVSLRVRSASRMISSPG